MKKDEIRCKQHFAANLRLEIARVKVTHTRLAEEIGVGGPSISNWLACKQLPTWLTFIKLCSFLKVEPWELLADPAYRLEMKLAQKQAKARDHLERKIS